ncbi:hypothetical protein DOTSEDRAFT_132990, partial [Dothistroma septosporum NZE10]
CTCNGQDEGQMVKCDNNDCVIQWFHIPCVGLQDAPGEHEARFCRDLVRTACTRSKYLHRRNTWARYNAAWQAGSPKSLFIDAEFSNINGVHYTIIELCVSDGTGRAIVSTPLDFGLHSSVIGRSGSPRIQSGL